MAIIFDENLTVDWESEGFDRFLRKKNSPLLRDYYFSEKAGRFGVEIITKNTGIMPKIIERSRLDDNAIIQQFDLGLPSAYVKQVSTGFAKPFTDFIFVVEWDTVNYKIRRFNWIDFEYFVQDGKKINTGLPLTPSDVYGIAVSPNNVFISWVSEDVQKISKFDYGLAHLETKNTPIALDKKICADDVYIYTLATSPNRIVKYKFSDNSYTTITWNSTEPFPTSLFAFDGEVFWGYDSTNLRIISFKINGSDIVFLSGYGIIDEVIGILNLNNVMCVAYKNDLGSVIITPLKI